MAQRVLATGGAGYIGTHTVVDLLEKGYDVTIMDNLYNSSEEAINRVQQITGKSVKFFKVDCTDKSAVEEVFKNEPAFDVVIHFAGLKAVGESVSQPLTYFRVNLMCAINVLEVMDKYSCKKFIFSSSATVYGDAPVPYSESSPSGHGITNPYGETKYVIEMILKDWYTAKGGDAGDWGIVILRYFNPIGAHVSGLIGEDPQGIPNNLMPYLAQVSVGRREFLTIHGNDYPTVDGTGVRDYLHVVDLARGHTAAVTRLTQKNPTLDIYNLGTGKGVSVMEMLRGLEKACGKPIPFKVGPRRTGDLAEVYSVPSLAKDELGWVTEKTVEQCCEDTWRWQSANPNGFRK
jgi:UDP-glucose 4-epimerase